MKDYVGENERILEAWKKEYKRREWNVDIASDGIMYRGPIKNIGGKWIHEKPCGTENQEWSEVPVRILYLTKDQPAGEDRSEFWNLRCDTYHYPNSRLEDYVYDSSSTFNRNLLRSIYGLYELLFEGQFVEFEDIDMKDAVRISDYLPFARINCKKAVGGSRCDDNVLKRYLRDDFELLKEQVVNLDADVLVCCRRNIIAEKINQMYNGKFVQVSEYIWYNESDNKLIIDTYHPGSRGSEKETYDLVVKPCFDYLMHYPKFLNQIKSHRK